jgi:hypothetical protein
MARRQRALSRHRHAVRRSRRQGFFVVDVAVVVERTTGAVAVVVERDTVFAEDSCGKGTGLV